MKKEQYICPHCGADLADFIHAEVIRYIRRRNTEKALASRLQKPERHAEMMQASLERLAKWRKAHPALASALAARAKDCRTPESFARQAETIRETHRRKSVKFAELLMEAKNAGREITPEVESELIAKAAEIVKAERKAENLAKKKAARAKR